jgi:hypothetical protein
MMAGLAPGASPAAAQDAAAEEEGLRLIGKLEMPVKETTDPLTEGTAQLAALDALNRRLYFVYSRSDGSFRIREYDLDTRIPQLLRDAQILESFRGSAAVLSPKTITIDTRRRRLLISHIVGAEPFLHRVEVVDLTSLKGLPGFNMTVAAPGVQYYGMRYSPEDDRLYFLGEAQPVYGIGVRDQNPESVIPATLTIVAAHDPESGAMVWRRYEPDCQIPLANRTAGALIARSIHQPVLYFGCVRPSYYPGRSGVMRVYLTPDATQLDAQRFRTEFFSVSGSYTGDGVRGNAEFDYETDRFFMQSVSFRTPGTWVFDGTRSAWAGFIAAPDNEISFIGFNGGNGRFYMGSAPSDAVPSYLVAADGRSSPVPQGRALTLTEALYSEIFADSGSNRIFVRMRDDKGLETFADVWVFEDRAVIPKPPLPIDFDSLTVDIAESARTAATFAGGVSGFGIHAHLVGGVGGIRSACEGNNVTGPPCREAPDAALGELGVTFAPGDRAVYASRVSSLDLRNVGASASANALDLDPITADEYETKVKDAAGEQVRQSTGNEELATSVEQLLEWPHKPATCLDGSGTAAAEEQTGTGGGSTVSCDLKKVESAATTNFTGFSIAGIGVLSSSFTSRLRNEPALGTVTESTAIARGVHVDVPGGASVAIGEVVAQATTAAHGRPGTASAQWTRTFSNVVVRDASGAVTFRCGDAETCDTKAAIDASNQALGGRMRVYLPEADQIGSPKGAFAGVQKSDNEFLNSSTVNNDNSRAVPAIEIVVFNDTVERSRLVIQLAAIQASSIYGISLLPGESGFPASGPGGFPEIPPIPPLAPPTFEPPAVGPGSAPRGPGARLISAALFLIRSPKDALLVGMIGLLFVGAGTLVARRRTLLRQLGAGS